MLNDDVVLYIKSFLVQCEACKTYNCTLHMRTCCHCRKSICKKCEKEEMIVDYTEYEVRMAYCVRCHQSLFTC